VLKDELFVQGRQFASGESRQGDFNPPFFWRFSARVALRFFISPSGELRRKFVTGEIPVEREGRAEPNGVFIFFPQGMLR
jgi:hypothetical protein